MNTLRIAKRKYSTPIVENIKLDKEISLTLDSAPPAGPDEITNSGLNAPDYFNNDPFIGHQA